MKINHMRNVTIQFQNSIAEVNIFGHLLYTISFYLKNNKFIFSWIRKTKFQFIITAWTLIKKNLNIKLNNTIQIVS